MLGDIETAAYDGAAALQQINDVKYNDLGSAFEAVKRSAEVALLPMASMIANTLTSLAPILTDTFEEISPVITDTLNACMPFVQDFLVGMGDTLKKVMPMVTELAAGILPLLAQLVGSFLPTLLDLAQQLLPPLMQIVQAILPPIASILATVLPMLTQIISTVLPVLANLIAALLPVITPLLEVALQIVNSVIMPLLPPLMQLIEALLPPVVSLLNAIMPLLSPLLAILEPIASVLGTIVGWVSKIVSFGSGVISKIAGLFGGGGGGSANVSGYATGGFTSGPSIAGEDPRYPTEAVISFNPAYRSQNLSYWAEAGRMLGASSEADYEPISSGSGTAVVYDLSGLSFSFFFNDTATTVIYTLTPPDAPAISAVSRTSRPPAAPVTLCRRPLPCCSIWSTTTPPMQTSWRSLAGSSRSLATARPVSRCLPPFPSLKRAICACPPCSLL